jgi:HPt (histidine-containing phosphotransfer) domain-containing protein
MNLFLAKPVSKQALVGAILRAISQDAACDSVAPRAMPDLACDRAALAALADDIGASSVGELVNLFIAETRARFRRMASAGADASRLGSEVHALKGTAGTVCASRLAGFAVALDARLRAGGSMSPAEFDALVAAFDAYVVEVADLHDLQPVAA